MNRGQCNVIMGPRNMIMGPWIVNRVQRNVIMVPCNVIMGPRNVNKGPWNVNSGLRM